jgi:transposase-like protein
MEKNIIKKGFDSKGNQKFYNKETKKWFTEAPKMREPIPQETKDKALAAYLEGMGFRAIGRIFGVAHTSVLYWVKKAALQLTNNFKITDLKEVELDEMHHYIKKK